MMDKERVAAGNPPRHWEDWTDQADAALAAMREPTEAMIAAGANADIPGGRYGEETFKEAIVFKEDVPVIWQAMIDEARKH